jgi:hypothetical protein
LEPAKKQKEQTTPDTDHKESAYPVSAPGFVKPLCGRSTSTGLPFKGQYRIPTSTTADLEALADDLEAYAVTTTTPAHDPLPRIYHREGLRQRLLVILAHTQDAASAWAAYRSLLVLPRSAEKSSPKVPFPHRHRLLRLIAAVPPRPLRTRGRFSQVFSVVRALREAGATVQRWEWNLLIDCAGKEGWRRPREEHFRAALGILAEMRDRNYGTLGGAAAAEALAPDIFSYTTLLAHAVRTRAPMAVRHAARLLLREGLRPGAHAHTTLLCFFARRGDLAGVRDTLFRMRRHMQEDDDGRGGDSPGSDASVGLTQASFNAVLWAFAYNGRLDVARAMYRVVRARAVGAGSEEEPEEREELEGLERSLDEREMIVIARDVVPDEATYHTLIQAHAYQGDLRPCLETLTDMLSALPPSSSPPLQHQHQHHRQLTASLASFRAIFLGFARHGVGPSGVPPTPTRTRAHTTTDEDEEQEQVGPQWTLSTLEALFARFLDLPHDTSLREPTLYWLVSAFARMSGDDVQEVALLLRSVFERLEARFGSSALMLTRGDDGEGGGVSRRGRLARIRERVFSSP